MTETTEAASTVHGNDAVTAPEHSSAGRRRKGSGLDAMLLPELKHLASSMGLRGTAGMPKGALIEAIRGVQGSGSVANGAGSARTTMSGQTVTGSRRGIGRVTG